MKGYDLSAPRLKSRWRKFRHDPAAFAADLPWPPVRGAALGAMLAATWLRDRAARSAPGAAQGKELCLSRRDGDLYALTDASGRAVRTPPAMLELEAIGQAVVVCSLAADDQVLGACLLAPRSAGFLPAGPRLARLRAYCVEDQAPLPDRLMVRAAAPMAVYAGSRRAGADRATALRAAWPAGRRRTFEMGAAAYARWIKRNEPSAQQSLAWAARAAALAGAPRIAVLMPVHDPEPGFLKTAINSVRGQSYEHWQLCIADDASTSAEVRQVLDAAAREDGRISLVRLEASAGVAAATNAALAKASGDVCLFLDHDDELAPFALAAVAEAFANHAEVVGVYSDEDTIDAQGRRSAPVFKPDLDRERLLRQNYVNHAFAIRTEVLRRLGGLSAGMDGAQDHDLVLRAAEAGSLRRLPHILYHWRSFPGGRSLSQREPARMWTARSAAVTRALARQNRSGRPVRFGPSGLELDLPLGDPAPSVAVIVPTRDGGSLLRACAAGVLFHTDYPALELHVVDNGSRDPATLRHLEALRGDPRVRVHPLDQAFNFSALNNAAVRRTAADVLVFLNDDVLVAEPRWLRQMVALASQDDVGAVGAKLLYPDGRLQHAGLILGLGPQGVAGHEFRGAPGDATGPQNRLGVTRQASAVTAACLAVSRAKFEAIGGFDEQLAVAFNDVDLCLRLREKGWRNLWTPLAQLVHMESASRGSEHSPEKAARFADEVRLMHARWGERLRGDPSYNPNLTLEDESFTPSAQSREPGKPGRDPT